jgi:signal transduction histidine kinase
MEQLFINLIQNSIQALQKIKGAERKIVIEINYTSSEEIEILFKDTGGGIDPQYKDKIWEPFFSTTGGTGFGLVIVKEILSKHNGRIKDASIYGKGAIFTINLPLKHIKGED